MQVVWPVCHTPQPSTTAMAAAAAVGTAASTRELQ